MFTHKNRNNINKSNKTLGAGKWVNKVPEQTKAKSKDGSKKRQAGSGFLPPPASALSPTTGRHVALSTTFWGSGYDLCFLPGKTGLELHGEFSGADLKSSPIYIT